MKMGQVNFISFVIILSNFLLIFKSLSEGYDDYYPKKLSTLEECRRPCSDNEPPRHCYYHFAVELFHTMGTPCIPCRQDDNDKLFNKPKCQCIEADGVKRTVLSINRLIPGPTIQVCEHDTLIIDVENKAEGLEVSLHWHGMFMNGYQYYDGVPMVTQCPIAFGSTFRYQFPASNAGTFLYHAHIATHRMDGQFGSLIVRQPPSVDPHFYLYDEDLPNHVIIVHDWMHYLSTEIHPGIYTTFLQPPDNILINGRGNFRYPNGTATNAPLEAFYVEPGKRYRFRFINALSLRCTSMFTIENHDLTIIAQDGDPVHPNSVTSLHSSGGERVDFILTTNQRPGAYWIQVRGLQECGARKIQQLGVLLYLGAPDKPRSLAPTYDKFLPERRVHNPSDGKCDTIRSNAVCVNQLRATEILEERLTRGEPDQRLILPLDVHVFEYGEQNPYYTTNDFHKTFPYPTHPLISTATIDGIIYTPPKQLLISSYPNSEDYCNRGHNTENCPDPCYCPHIVHLKKDSIVEVVLYDKAGLDIVSHPFHLHGYSFTVLKIGAEITRNLTKNDINVILQNHDRVLDTVGYSRQSPRKDTILVPITGYVIFRFLANNPGWWFFHCHIDWHSVEGMNMIFHVGEPEDLPPVPYNFPRCGSWVPPI